MEPARARAGCVCAWHGGCCCVFYIFKTFCTDKVVVVVVLFVGVFFNLK